MNIHRNPTIVIKIGTDLVNQKTSTKTSSLSQIIKDLCQIKARKDLNFAIVSSGAVGSALTLLGLNQRPNSLPKKQALAAIGQIELMKKYVQLFQRHSKGQLIPAQILITRTDLDNRIPYINILNTIHELFSFKNVIPIINENDTTATEELKFGDNDTLSARIAVRLNAQLLILLTNVNGLYNDNPNKNPRAELIPRVERLAPEIFNFAKDTENPFSIGGMRTKLEAVKITWQAGIPTVIANGHQPHIISSILNGEAECTRFDPPKTQLPFRKTWIAFGRTIKGVITVDEGAKNALIKKGSSLLPVGITSVSGEFRQGDCVSILAPDGTEIGRGLVNANSKDLQKICGKKTSEIKKILPDWGFEEVIHRDNMVLLTPQIVEESI